MESELAPVFLTAEWRYLVMLSYEVDPELLVARVPDGCDLDTWQGKTFISIVAFRFLRTRVRGLPIPFHRDFDEVNLRFYVKRDAAEGVRRGVVFIKEIVPRAAIAWVARNVYNENYVALPMRHHVEPPDFVYEWKHAGDWIRLGVETRGEPVLSSEGAEETFITEHYWGYARQRDGGTLEYRVEHPRWNVWHAASAALEGELATLYGPELAECLRGEPSSVFVADGSPVVVREGRRISG